MFVKLFEKNKIFIWIVSPDLLGRLFRISTAKWSCRTWGPAIWKTGNVRGPAVFRMDCTMFKPEKKTEHVNIGMTDWELAPEIQWPSVAGFWRSSRRPHMCWGRAWSCVSCVRLWRQPAAPACPPPSPACTCCEGQPACAARPHSHCWASPWSSHGRDCATQHESASPPHLCDSQKC